MVSGYFSNLLCPLLEATKADGNVSEMAIIIIKVFGIVPFMATHLKGCFFVFFTIAFLIFLAPAGQIA